MRRGLAAIIAVAVLGVAGLGISYTSSSGAVAGVSPMSSTGVGGCALNIDPASLTAAGATRRMGEYTTRQLQMAALIVARGRAKAVPARGLVVGLITALQESRLRVLANSSVPQSYRYPHDDVGHDHDSLGTFQQRPSAGWGTVAQIMDPSYAADQFFDHLIRVPGWESMAPTVAAQAVQGSAFPGAYAAWTSRAAQFVAAFGHLAPDAITGCQGEADLPTDSVRAAIVAAARRYVGTPYVYDAGDPSGPTKALGGCDAVAIGGCAAVGFDCSGLSLYAWARAGISLDHYAATQYTQGRQIPVAQARPGDLLFYATNPADAASIHHVTVFVGDDKMIEAPQSGQRVLETAVRTDGELMPMAVEPLRATGR